MDRRGIWIVPRRASSRGMRRMNRGNKCHQMGGQTRSSRVRAVRRRGTGGGPRDSRCCSGTRRMRGSVGGGSVNRRFNSTAIVVVK